jgi:cell surface protein SprA
MLKKKIVYITICALGILSLAFNQSFAQNASQKSMSVSSDSTGNLIYPFDDEGAFQYPDQIDKGPLYLKSPSNIERKIEYNPLTKQYVIFEKIGGIYYRLPKTMGLKEYVKYDFNQSIKDYWRSRKDVEEIATGEKTSALIPQIKIESEAFSNIFGGDVIDIKPQGYVEVSFGAKSNYNGNPIFPERLRRTTNFDFDNQINIGVRGKIGEKVDMQVNFNSEATFDFDNKMKIEYTGKEDEILRKIEAGNVSLPLNGSLIQGGTNLFGVKTEMQFGKLNLTTIVSQNKGESQMIETEGGAQKTSFKIQASDYDENRHFFLSKYFKENFNKALSKLPKIYSQVIINKVEVWVTNTSQNFAEARDIIGFVDLGEQAGNIRNIIPEFGPVLGQGYPNNTVPYNGANYLYQQLTDNYSGIRESKSISKTMSSLEAKGFKDGTYWGKIDQARKLAPSEYFINKELGFISLNSPLNNDEVLAVAFNFTIGDTEYKVGEFSTDAVDPKQTLILKLLKGTTFSPELPTWDFMMKNVYNLGAYDLTSQDFDFNIVYKNETNNYVNSLPAGELKDSTLLRVMNLDNLNSQLDYTEKGDGMFDFVEGVTVISQSGKIIFPVLEPFGANIASQFLTDTTLRAKYAFYKLYRDTKFNAEQDFDHNKFYMVGSYKGSSSSEISLNTFNLAPGSVKVVAGSTPLVENIDYTVDYALGKVKIINQSYIDAGTPIQVSTESQDMISMQRKTLVGTYASYAASEKLNIGGTLLYMNERPMTNKVDMGEEPVSNLMLGLDFQYRDRSQLLTDFVNLLPFYESKTESSISIEGEVAKLFPGKSKITGNNVYIDDFEGVETSISMATAFGWQLASTPRDQNLLFPESNFSDSLIYGYNRAKLAWYHIDRLFTEASTNTPAHIKADAEMRSNQYMRTVTVQEIFPGRQSPLMTSSTQTIFNLAYFPSERGPYNYDAGPSSISRGIDSKGDLIDPGSRWGGIMRDIQSPNFESQNIEYIEFWLLDPFYYDQGNDKGGDLYFNLGEVSEDILRDSRKAFENGLPTGGEVTDVDTTVWGRVSTEQMLKQAFTSTDQSSREAQDVGFDGLGDEDERSYFNKYLKKIESIVTQDAYQKVFEDPSGDNFHYYKGDDYDKEKLNIIDRYKNFNGLEGNTPVNQSQNDIESSSKTEPDIEDLNKDNTMNESEAYYQYHISLRPEDMQVGKNHIVDKVLRKTHKLPDGTTPTVNWYQFKIPVRLPDDTIGNISGFKSIRFMRMFLKNFEDSIILRFGTLALIRSDWTVERKVLEEAGAIDLKTTQFEMTSINIEENQSRKPINYILPPGIEREIDPTNPGNPIQMNEQSMLLKVKDLDPGITKAVYKKVGLDMRQYKKLKMEVHAEAIEGYALNDYDLSLVVRLGSDYDNYYEYEVPLKLTPVPGTTYDGTEIYSPHRYIVWPDENRLDLDLSIFPEAKLKRDEEVRKAGATTNSNEPLPYTHIGYQGGKNTIWVKGNPSIGEVEIIHIGIKNSKKKNLGPKSAEIWVNELRLSDFDEKGGWASNARMSLRLADLGSVSLSGRTQSVGWGGINQVASQRSLKDVYQYDIAANIEMGKLLPEKVGLHLPIYYNLSKSVSSPQYNPLSSDIKMADALALIESPEERDTLKSISQEVNTRKSFTVNNITLEPLRKKADRKPLPTDIENFSVSYSRSSQESQSIDIAEQIGRNEKGSFDYNYSIVSQPFEPLKKVKFLDNDFLRIVKDFNFSYLPEMISFRTDYQRNYNQRKARDNSGNNIELPRTIQKDFLWNRNFDLRYNITRNLKFDFTNKNINRIDQNDRLEDRSIDPKGYNEIQRDLWDSIRTFGRPVNYEHSVDIQYTVPINRLPLLDFTSTRVTYRGNYEWIVGPILAPSDDYVDVGNTIRNGMNINATANFNLLTLYNRIPYFKDVNQKFQTSQRRYGSKNKPGTQRNAAKGETDAKNSKSKELKFNEKKVSFKANVPKSIFHRLGTEKVKILVLTNKGDTIKGEMSVVNENRINFKTAKNISDAEVLVVGTIENSEPLVKQILDRTTRILLGVRSIRASYTQNGGSEIPGFLGVPQSFRFGAQDFTPKGSSTRSLAPGIPFLMGWQDTKFAMKAANDGWISKDTSITKQFLDQRTETWNFGLQVEPFANIKIDISGNRRESKNNSSFIQYSDLEKEWKQFGIKETGNFDMTIFTLKTAFKEGLGDTTVSELFNKFRGANRQVILNRINQQRGYIEGIGYSKSTNPGDTTQGVSLNSSDVVIPAFIAAYTGIDPAKIPLTARPGLAWIRPNWRINYNGDPQNVSWMKDIFTSLNFTHSYRATYSIGNFETNLAYRADDESGLSWVRSQQKSKFDSLQYFVPQLDINSVNIQEDFSPLINIDAAFVNDLSANFEMRRTRTLNFSFSNMQLSEMIKNELSIGIGYRFSGLDMIIRTKRKSESVSNDVNMRLELSSSDFKTTFRKIDEDKGILQSGMKLFSADFQADYMISDKLTIKLYVNYRLQDPHMVGSEGFLQKETKFGLSFNYSIM